MIKPKDLKQIRPKELNNVIFVARLLITHINQIESNFRDTWLSTLQTQPTIHALNSTYSPRSKLNLQLTL